jgi:hypothetical protein
VCACYGGLPAGLDSRLPASCRGNSGEADYAKPENLDSGPQVSFNLLCVDGLGCLWWCGACLVFFLCQHWLRLLLPASDCYRLKLGSGCVVCCMDLSITPQKGIPSQSDTT